MKYPNALQVNIKIKRDPLTDQYVDTVGQVELQYEDPKLNKVLRFSQMGLYGESGRPWLTSVINSSPHSENADFSMIMPDFLAVLAVKTAITIIHDYRDAEAEEKK